MDAPIELMARYYAISIGPLVASRKIAEAQKISRPVPPTVEVEDGKTIRFHPFNAPFTARAVEKYQDFGIGYLRSMSSRNRLIWRTPW
jgi:hypothetical protein